MRAPPTSNAPPTTADAQPGWTAHTVVDDGRRGDGAPLIGRADELARLRSARVATIWGPPGIGKSALARAAAGAAAIVVELSTTPLDRLDEALSRSLGSPSPDALVYARDVAGTTLVLDGLERHDATDARGIVGRLVAARVIATTAGPLGLSDEVSVRLEPLAPPDARALFVARSGIDSEIATSLADDAGGWPLALELVARLARTLGVDAARSALRGAPSSSPVHRGVEVALGALSDDERAALLALAVAPDAAPLDAVAVWAELPRPVALAAVATLVERSLARLDGGEVRVLEAVRDVACARASHEERERAELAHARWAGELLAGRARGHGGVDAAGALALLRRRRAHLETAVDRTTTVAPRLAAALALDLDSLAVLDGPGEPHLAMLERVAAANDDPVLTAELAARMARVALLHGANGAALLLADVPTAALPPATAARLAGVAAHARLNLRDLGAAAADAERQAELAAAVTEPAERDLLLAFAHQARALVALLRGDDAAASSHFDAAISLARLRGADRMLALALANAAELGGLPGETRAARLREAHALFVELGDHLHAAKLTLPLARLATSAERERRTTALIDRARTVADHAVQAAAWLDLVELAEERGDAQAATRALEHARAALARTDDAEEHARASRLSGSSGRRTEPQALRVRRDGARAELGDVAVDLSNRRALPRLLVALARDAASTTPRGLDVHDLFAAGWPGERASVASLAARVHVAVRTLRTLGLASAIVTQRGRYFIADGLRVGWLDLPRFSR